MRTYIYYKYSTLPRGISINIALKVGIFPEAEGRGKYSLPRWCVKLCVNMWRYVKLYAHARWYVMWAGLSVTTFISIGTTSNEH